MDVHETMDKLRCFKKEITMDTHEIKETIMDTHETMNKLISIGCVRVIRFRNILETDADDMRYLRELEKTDWFNSLKIKNCVIAQLTMYGEILGVDDDEDDLEEIIFGIGVDTEGALQNAMDILSSDIEEAIHNSKDTTRDLLNKVNEEKEKIDKRTAMLSSINELQKVHLI